MNILYVEIIRANAILPTRATEGSAGYDICACIEQPLCLPAGGRAVIPSGIAVALPEKTAGFLFGRSGLGVKHGIVPSNAVGVIDSDYRGELLVGLSNHSPQDYLIEPGERIAQLVILPVLLPELEVVGELPQTQRGSGGFGSTGRGRRGSQQLE